MKYEYTVITGKQEKDLERKLNRLAHHGYRLVSATVVNLGPHPFGGTAQGDTLTVIMEKVV